MRNSAILITGIVVAVLGLFWFGTAGRTEPPAPTACTEEAKLCPDGSYVSRTGPDCAFAACPVIATSTPNVLTGVRGSVLLGPTCPVERNPPDPACAEKPYATSIFVYRSGANKLVYVIGTSSATGTFNIPLPSGKYTLEAQGGKTLPRCASVAVTVPTKGYASTTISCDTGIR